MAMQGGGAEGVVVRTGGTRAQRKLRAAQHDVESLEYALSKARPALEHAQAQVDRYEDQLASAKEQLAGAQAAADAEPRDAPEEKKPRGHGGKGPKASVLRKKGFK